MRLGVQRVVARSREHRDAPSEQRGGGGYADTDPARPRHVQEPSGFPGQGRRRRGDDRAVVGRDK